MLNIVCSGKKSKGWLEAGLSDYEKRLRKPFDVRWTFTDDVENTVSKLRKPRDFLIVLDERGKILSSPEISQLLDRQFTFGNQVIIAIGGPYGFSDEFRNNSDFLWSFSKLVFPHELMRLYLIEQLYRAQEIRSGSKYHHE